ncbi:PREDICTED: protein dopey-1 homolog [Ceratosolen solmsi marchali]|uniref:Protein dopey-1 homolog n=1 Tax=Ceratosolen solmsi marchali TaxID=326594 RepID=A0AAJ6YJX3_9HYME|nr:PREDICTED: protein dopey-1 homolog [Ceratosolen solmsi marchali]
MGSIALEEYELMKDSKYRVYVSAVDKALKNFEYTSEWADLISALGKLNKVLLSHMKFPVIPRRIKISKRLAQCMHPALPPGVHLKALETYDIIFKCMGTNRLSHELFIYSAGLFPLLGNAAMNVRPLLLTVYETHFVPLGERLRPGLSGFLSGVLPGLEEGSDHFDRTNSLLEKVCDGVGPEHFYACLWDCLASNSGIRLPAISFALTHFHKKLPMEDQLYIMGTNVDIMVSALCAGVQDSSVLVQRSALDLLLVGFPVHNSQLSRKDMVNILTAALTTILRRDMSLNRRLFAWLLGTEVNTSILKKKEDRGTNETSTAYFDVYSKDMLIDAIKSTLKTICNDNPQDLKPYRILISLLDKPDIGPVILDDILYEVYRTFYNACSITSKHSKSSEVIKSVNLLFSTLEPQYVWIHCGYLFEKACEKINSNRGLCQWQEKQKPMVKEVGSGLPSLVEICMLTEFLLETVSLDAFIDTPSEHLPSLFHSIIDKLSNCINFLLPMEITMSLKLCGKILSKVQPAVSANSTVEKSESGEMKLDSNGTALPIESGLAAIPLEKSQSDSKLNKPTAVELTHNLSDRSPSPRRRANSSGAPKKNDKKTKKKSSKSTSKLSDAYSIQVDVSSISVIVSEDAKSPSSMSRNKSLEDLNSSDYQIDTASLGLSADGKTTFGARDASSMCSLNSVSRGPSPAQQIQHSMLEKCLRLYEKFYVKFIIRRVLEDNMSVPRLSDYEYHFGCLRMPSCKESFDERTRHLEKLLKSKLDPEDLKVYNQNSPSPSEIEPKGYLVYPYVESIDSSYWEEVLRVASSLLVELSTFPTYFLPGDGLLEEEEPRDNANLPKWLKVLIVCSCWLNVQPSLQLTSIATLLDLIALSKAHSDSARQTHGEGVTTVVIVPLLKQWHITYLKNYTDVFQMLAHRLWNHLGELPVHKFRIRCVELLHELHHALDDSCDAVEDAIGLALMNESMEKKIDAFNRFVTLWHLGRDIETNPRLRGCLRGFDKSLLKLLDNLELTDNSPLKLQSQSWLLHCLVRNDISRVVNPVLTMLLDPSTCRMSVLHVSIQHSNIILTKSDPTTHQEKSENSQDDAEGTANIYAISSVDGNVIYHVSNGQGDRRRYDETEWRLGFHKKKSSIINPVKVKRIFAVTTLTSDSKSYQYVTERNQTMRELEVPPSISGNRRISVFVNPLSQNANENSNDSLTEDDSLSTKKSVTTAGNTTTAAAAAADVLKNARRFKKPEFNKGSTGSLDESLFESADSTTPTAKSKDKNENTKALNGEIGSSSLDSITNSLASSSPEIVNTNKICQQQRPKKEHVMIPNSAREIAGTIIKGKYHSMNSEFNNSSYEVNDTVGSFEATTEIPSWTMGDEEADLETSTTAEEYFSNSSGISVVEEVLNVVVDKVIEICEANETNKNCEESIQLDNGNTKRNSSGGIGVHNLHSHMLLYCGVYDSNRTLYALRILRNELLTNARMFLGATATTGVANNPRSAPLLALLARHRKSIFGRNFHGEVANTEFVAAYRSSMYLELLISVCLYFARSYYPNLGQMRLTQEEISGNRQVQLASTELLTLIFSELIPIVRDSGKGFSCYIIDLLTKCKVQKVALHCLVSSVLAMKNAQKDSNEVFTFTEEIVQFNDPVTETNINKCKYRASDHTEAFQMQLLRLLLALIMLEHQCGAQKGEDVGAAAPSPTTPSRAIDNLSGNTLKYIAGAPIPQQSMFLASILSALKLEHMRHLHQYWTTLVTSSLPFMASSLTQIVTSVIHQLCCNIEQLASYYVGEDALLSTCKSEDLSLVECCLPADYTVTHLEALTFLLHYCLLDTSQQIVFSFNQPSSAIQTGVPGANPGQIFNNLIHVFMPTPLATDINGTKDKSATNEQLLNARRTALSHLPRIIASLSTLWQAVIVTKDNEQATCVVGSPRVVKHQLLELLSPISFHHGVNFLAAVAVAWHERRQPSINSKRILPEACPNQQVLVQLVSAIRVMPIDTLVQTVHQVIKTPPPISGVKQDFSLEVSVLELLYIYMQSNTSQTLVESWASLLGLLKDSLSSSAPAQFLLLAILNEYVQKCPPMQEKKDIRDLQDITAKLVESCSQIAGACLEQTTWLRRNLAVREDVLDVSEGSTEGKEGKAGTVTPGTPPNSAYSVQAQAVLAEILAPLFDVSYGSQEKERVATLLTNLMYNVTPYLKNHTTKNIASFTACSQLLSSLSGYPYTRKAWRKDVLDLLLDPAFFQMTAACLPFWRTIIDNLMTHDNTTFRDLLTKVSIAQSSSISIFSSKEQEYEQRAQLLKRLAFVILCSEMDQYHKYMPEIQERLADSLRLPQVIPSIQAQVFLCFRVLLLRVSPQHATSLWPVIVSELVQVFLHIEQELSTDTEEFSRQNSSHIKLLSALDSSWAVNSNNGLQAHGHPHWLHLQLAAAKLLDLALLLPAHRLPQFQMYRWAFVGDAASGSTENNNLSSDFVPHITRIAKLMDNKFKEGESLSKLPAGELLLTSSNIRSLQDLHHFFTALSRRPEESQAHLNVAHLESVIEQDFLEKMPSLPAR